jgi:hypothetical protein
MVKLNEAIELAVVRKVGINQITKSYRQENSETNRDVAKLCLVREDRRNETKKLPIQDNIGLYSLLNFHTLKLIHRNFPMCNSAVYAVVIWAL